MPTPDTQRAWVEVDASALLRNATTVASALTQGARLLPMVKADGYGLGMTDVVETLKALDPWGFGVATVDEGHFLRSSGLSGPILVFSPSGLHDIPAAAQAGLTLSVSHRATLEAMEERAAELGGLAFHLEVDTGMGRAGFDPRDVEEWGPAAQRLDDLGVRWQGCFTHFHSADEKVGREATHTQLRRFRAVLESLDSYAATRRAGFLRHVANSAAGFMDVGEGWDLARPGIFLYGGRAGPAAPDPDPVAAVRARVVHLRDAHPGDTVGYGATHVAEADAGWATVAIGYGDGLPRILSNRGHALVQGVRVPIIGRISMDVTVVDISAVPSVSLGEVVTFVGCDGDEEITLDEVARLAGTISYEILTGLTLRLPRVWV